jgi:hypothetical protein
MRIRIYVARTQFANEQNLKSYLNDNHLRSYMTRMKLSINKKTTKKLRSAAADRMVDSSHLVASVEDQPIRFGNLDWVPPFCKDPDDSRSYLDWRFKFMQGAELHLNLQQYRRKEFLEKGWVLALLKSADLLGQGVHAAKQLTTLVQQMVEDPKQELKGADLMLGIDQRWKKHHQKEKQKAVEAFLHYKREPGTTLRLAVRALRDLLFEARRHKYEPDEGTAVAIFESLLNEREKPLHSVFKSVLADEDESEDDSGLELCVKALEKLALDLDTGKLHTGTQEGNTKALGASNQEKQKIKDKNQNGKGPRRNGYAKDADEKAEQIRKCTRCGRARCKAMKPKGKKEDCFAADKECFHCGKTGHLSFMCKSAKGRGTTDMEKYGKQKSKANAGTASEETEPTEENIKEDSF